MPFKPFAQSLIDDFGPRLDLLQSDAQDALAMQVLAPLTTTYLPWSQFALRPSAMVKVLNEILLNRRTCIVECGGGITTFYIAQLLKQQGRGHLYTIEHDRGWIEWLQDLLNTQELAAYVSIIPASLTSCDVALNDTHWYDTQRIYTTLADRKIDLLIVDGPPAYDELRQLSRYPALPVLHPFLAENWTVMLDDIGRAGETAILQRWEAEFGVQFERHYLDGGIAIARSQSGFHIG
jgi:Methyltransferase domain